MSIENTLGNKQWLVDNELKIKSLFPNSWTNIYELNATDLGVNVKLLGIDWRSKEEFEMIMVFFEKVGFTLRDGQCIKSNPASVLTSNEI